MLCGHVVQLRVKALIKRQYQIELSLHTVDVCLRSWWLIVQYPARRVLQWKSEQYPEIAKRAKLEGAVIYWADETAVEHDTNFG